jgi:signal transduction histidine kinase
MSTKAKSVNEPPWGDAHMQQVLISAIVHDIRTPLRYFMWTARSLQQDLQRGEPGDSLLERAQLLYSSAERMHAMVEDLLQYSRIQLGTVQDDRVRRVNLHLTVAAKAILFYPMAYAKATQIINQVDPAHALETDPDCLAVILHNILDNAVKFTSGGSIRVTSARMDDGIQLLVSDTGRGMSHECMDWCNGTPEHGHGAGPGGLGLLLVRELLDKIHGRLKVTQASPSGTVVALEFSETL